MYTLSLEVPNGDPEYLTVDEPHSPPPQRTTIQNVFSQDEIVPRDKVIVEDTVDTEDYHPPCSPITMPAPSERPITPPSPSRRYPAPIEDELQAQKRQKKHVLGARKWRRRVQQLIQVSVKNELQELIARKKRMLEFYLSTNYSYGRSRTLHLILGHSSSKEIRTIAKRIKRGIPVTTRDAVKYEVRRHQAVSQLEVDSLEEDQIAVKLTSPVFHLKEVEVTNSKDPYCPRCADNHQGRGGCAVARFGGPILATSNYRSLSEDQLKDYAAIFVGNSEITEFDDLALPNLLNLTPTMALPLLYPLYQGEVENLVDPASPTKELQEQLVFPLLHVVQKLGASCELPLLIMAPPVGNMTKLKGDTEAFITVIRKLQEKYEGPIYPVTSIATYKPAFSMDEYQILKEKTKIQADMLLAHCLANGMCLLTLNIQSMPLDEGHTVYTVRPEWSFEPLFNSDGDPKREFHRRLAAELGKKLKMIDQVHCTKEDIKYALGQDEEDEVNLFWSETDSDSE